jgi:hypothetical protein
VPAAFPLSDVTHAQKVWTLTEAKKKNIFSCIFSCLTFLRIIIVVVSFSFIC